MLLRKTVLPKTIKKLKTLVLTRNPRMWESISRLRLKVNPRSTGAHMALGHALMLQAAYDQAANSYRAAISLTPELEDAPELLSKAKAKAAEAYVGIGNTLEQTNRQNEAIATYQKALALDFQCFSAYRALLKLYKQQGKTADVAQLLDQLQSIQLSTADDYATLGDIFLQNDRGEAAYQCYQKAIELRPDDIPLYHQAGIALFLAGKFDDAAAAWQVGIEKQQHLAKTHHMNLLGIRVIGNSWLLAIGHIAQLDAYFKLGQLGWRAPQRTVLVLKPEMKVPNQPLLSYWEPFLTIISTPDWLPIPSPYLNLITDEFWTLTFPDGSSPIYYKAAALVQEQWERENRPPLLTLKESDRERGRNCLEQLGVPPNAWFVCLHVRESGFHKSWNDTYVPTRNADIDTYTLAIEAIVAQGGWVIRVGDPSMKPLSPMPQVIDYAHSPLKSDWMDIFLCAQCRFFIGMNSGLGLVPPLFGVPCAMTNWVPMGVLPYFGQDRFIPKLYWSKRDNRYISFEDMMRPPVGFSQFVRDLIPLDLEVVDNTPEDLRDLVVEMLEQTGHSSAKSDDTEEDIALRTTYFQLAQTIVGYRGSPIGRAFLRKYRQLLNTAHSVTRHGHQTVDIAG
ncbi:MAG: TIGR04372 family glycosyltransferase [Cyanobacteria bacterium]|nr:TIGR04372 family glycosyltransferase [Cyanobacteriota bacterium]MDW8200090.1 TIGR04372 family glycosyltransferase [Cyanobacteriota bacterium SKYGB_h_bin112]